VEERVFETFLGLNLKQGIQVSNLYQCVSCETVPDRQKNKEVIRKVSHEVYHETVSRDTERSRNVDYGPR